MRRTRRVGPSSASTRSIFTLIHLSYWLAVSPCIPWRCSSQSRGRGSHSTVRNVVSILVNITWWSFFRLITSADQRLNVDQIKRHSFFYGVDWGKIRQIDSPFVPHLRSVTDTSYFPTEELDQVAEEHVDDGNDASKDLAFLGSASDFSWHVSMANAVAGIPSSDSRYPLMLSDQCTTPILILLLRHGCLCNCIYILDLRFATHAQINTKKPWPCLF